MAAVKAARSRPFGRPTISVGTAVTALALLTACRSDTLTTSAGAPRPSGPAATLTSGSGTNIIPITPGSQAKGDARGLNASGQVTGAVFPFTAQDFQPYRWDATNGLTPITGCCDTRYGEDINDAGVVVGTAQQSAIVGLRGFVAAANTFTTLSILPGADAEGNARAVAINGSGQIVGSSVTPSFTMHAVLWSAAGVIQDLGTLGGSNSAAIDINASGQVIGSSQTSGNAATHYFSWTAGGGMQDLNTTVNANITSVVEINDAGQIVGTYGAPNGQSHAFLYTPGSGLLDLGTLGGTTSAPTGLNNNGQVVGRSTLANASTHAFLWTPTDGMEDITAVTGITEVRRLNNNLQTLTGTVPANTGPSLANPLPQRVQLTVTAGGNRPPVASFTANCVGQSNPNQCAFDASASTDDAGIVSYSWTWGNGRSETKTVPTTRNTWAAAGVYTVTLKVTDAAGLTGVSSQQVTVGTLPPNQPPTVQMRSGYPNGGETFQQGVPVDFSAIATDPEDGVISNPNYSWSSSIDGFLGTGSTISGVVLSAGTHTITVTATDSKGATGTASISITISPKPTNQPPTAGFSWSCTGQTYPHQCAFDASASSDDVGIVSYKWSWGNGRSETKTVSTTRNTWASGGTYTVTLTVTDGSGLTASTSRQVAVP